MRYIITMVTFVPVLAAVLSVASLAQEYGELTPISEEEVRVRAYEIIPEHSLFFYPETLESKLKDIVLIPIYDLEDNILYYFVLYCISEESPKNVADLYILQKEICGGFIEGLKQVEDNNLDTFSYISREKLGKAEFMMDGYYYSFVYPAVEERELFGDINHGLPQTMAFYWFVFDYLKKTYGVEPKFNRFRCTKELNMCFEFEVGDEDILAAALHKSEPYATSFNFNIITMKKSEAHSFVFSDFRHGTRRDPGSGHQ